MFFGLWVFSGPNSVLASTYGSGTYSGSTYDSSSSTTTSSNNTPSKPGCLDATPGGKVPWLYGAIVTSTSTVQLYFTSADDPIDHYVLEYGTSTGAYQYGSENIGDKNTHIYTVSKLNANSTYYFRVRGGNGCAVGGWSNELSTKTRSYTANNQLELTSEMVIPTPTPGPVIPISTTPTVSPAVTNDYQVKISVKDQQQKPVDQAEVTLHSEPRTGKTNSLGEVVFDQVEAGEHTVTIAYQGYTGEQKVFLSGDVKRVDLNITIQAKNQMFSKTSVAIIGALVLGIFILILIVWRSRRRQAEAVS